MVMTIWYGIKTKFLNFMYLSLYFFYENCIMLNHSLLHLQLVKQEIYSVSYSVFNNQKWWQNEAFCCIPISTQHEKKKKQIYTRKRKSQLEDECERLIVNS